MIRIISRKEGFRRCGVAHTEKPADYEDDRFTEKDLEVLKAEPMLIVQELPNPPEDPQWATIAEIKATLNKLGIEYPVKTSKADLIKLLKDNTAAPSEE